MSENAALVQMTDRSSVPKAILIADRNYEAYNGIAHIEKKRWKYLIRIRDTAGMTSPFRFKPDCNLDVWKTITLTRKQTNAFKKMEEDDPARLCHLFLRGTVTPLQESCACPSQPEGSQKRKSTKIQWLPL